MDRCIRVRPVRQSVTVNLDGVGAKKAAIAGAIAGGEDDRVECAAATPDEDGAVRGELGQPRYDLDRSFANFPNRADVEDRNPGRVGDLLQNALLRPPEPVRRQVAER